MGKTYQCPDCGEILTMQADGSSSFSPFTGAEQDYWTILQCTNCGFYHDMREPWNDQIVLMNNTQTEGAKTK